MNNFPSVFRHKKIWGGIVAGVTAAALLVYQIAFAANTHSLDIERSANQYATFADQDVFPTGDITVEMWVKPGSYASEDYTNIFGKGDLLSDGSGAIVFQNNDGITRLRSNLQNDPSGSSGYVNSVSSTDFDSYLGQWVHVAMTWRAGSGNFIKLYVNGIEESSYTTQTNSGATAIYNSTSGGVVGGMRYNSNVGSFDGQIDDVRVWNVVRTQAEIAGSMNVELSGNTPGLVYYWKLNNTVDDETSNNNDLTLVNGASFVADPAYAIQEQPKSPTGLQVSPIFSAIYNPGMPAANAAYYRLQISTYNSETAWANPYWDSGKQALPSPLAPGQRSSAITSLAVLAPGQTYFWRIRFWDESNRAGRWSTTTPIFMVGN